MANLIEVTDGLLRLPRLPFRLFYAQSMIAQREISNNAYFNPLSALEFRPEFDRIASRPVLELIANVPGEQAHRLVALTFLSLFRMLRYLRLLEALLRDPTERGAAPTHVPRARGAAVGCPRARRIFAAKGGPLLADSYESDIMRVGAPTWPSGTRRCGPKGIGSSTFARRSTVSARPSRLEMRRAFEHDLPAVDTGATLDDLRIRVATTVTNLRPALQNAIIFLAKSLGARLDAGGVFDEKEARRQSSDRLRRDVWILPKFCGLLR